MEDSFTTMIDESTLQAQGFEVRDGVLVNYTGREPVVAIPNGIRGIGRSAFSRSSSLRKVIIPESVKSIGEYAFSYCEELNTVDIGAGITAIPRGCFMSDRKLLNVIFPYGIDVIEEHAFYNCSDFSIIGFRSKETYMVTDLKYIDDRIIRIGRIGMSAFKGCKMIDVAAIKAITAYADVEAFDHVPNASKASNERRHEADSRIGSIADEQTREPNTQSKDDSVYGSLIEGFIVVEGVIINDYTGEKIKDAEILELGLSARPLNCLARAKGKISSAGSNTIKISDLLRLSGEDLINLPNMGVKSVKEIIERIKGYLSEKESPGSVAKTSMLSIAPGYSVIDGIIINNASKMTVPDADVMELDLSIRARNSLCLSNVTRLSKLVMLSEWQLRSFPNMGAKTVDEIVRFVPAYLEVNQVETTGNIDPEATDDLKAADTPVVLPVIVKADTPESEDPVLAQEYTNHEGIIYHRRSHKVIPDAPVEILNLSNRSWHYLKRNGINLVSDLIGMPYDEFRNIRSLGSLSAGEITGKLEQYLKSREAVSNVQIVPDKSISRNEVFDYFSKHPFTEFSFDELITAFSDAKAEELRETIEKLVAENKLTQNEDRYTLMRESFFASIDSAESSSEISEREAFVLRARASGTSLEEVGAAEGITRERVRQIENKAFNKVTRRGSAVFDEDRYAYVYRTYSFEKEFYFKHLGLNERTWYYLSIKYKRGSEDPVSAVEDKSIAPSIRRKIEQYIHRGQLFIDGQYIQKNVGAIEDHVLEKYCKDEMPLDEFFKVYERFLKENSIADKNLKYAASARNSRSNRLAASNKLLWKQNQRLRYYDIEGGDYTELFDTLNLSQYKNIEFSTRKLFNDHPELMRQYDLRDEYELHNLLKKLHVEKENPDIVFGRMPSVSFGTFERDAAVKEIMFALAPVSQDDLVEMLSLEYGYSKSTIAANWLSCVSEYYHQGVYSIDYDDMPEEHVAKLKEALTDDFYYFTELRDIYRRVVPDADVSLLSTYNLKKMGFFIGTSYVLQHYDSADAYFRSIITRDDVVDLTSVSKRFSGLSSFSALLSGLKRELEIIEFEPYQYINIRRLEKIGLGKNELKKYADRVWSFLVDDDYFSIRSLRKTGYEDELDNLGFGDLFYASLLKQDERFSWQRVGGAIVFDPKGRMFSVHDFLVDRINKERSVDVDRFVSDLSENYGIAFDRWDVMGKAKGGEVYFDPIMDKLYANYETYFEEI